MVIAMVVMVVRVVLRMRRTSRRGDIKRWDIKRKG
jgi:hypothetical protein